LKKKSKLNLAYSFIIDKNFEESKRRDNEYCFERITEANRTLEELGIEAKHFMGTHGK